MAFKAEIVAGEMKSNDHAEGAWVGAEDFDQYHFAPADLPFVWMIRQGQMAHLVYSTETGRMCPSCGRPLKKCGCRISHAKSSSDSRVDDILRIKRETKGRGGKTVTTISGFDENEDVVKQLAARLKNLCGTGGSAKNGIIMIQETTGRP